MRWPKQPKRSTGEDPREAHGRWRLLPARQQLGHAPAPTETSRPAQLALFDKTPDYLDGTKYRFPRARRRQWPRYRPWERLAILLRQGRARVEQRTVGAGIPGHQHNRCQLAEASHRAPCFAGCRHGSESRRGRRGSHGHRPLPRACLEHRSHDGAHQRRLLGSVVTAGPVAVLAILLVGSGDSRSLLPSGGGLCGVHQGALSCAGLRDVGASREASRSSTQVHAVPIRAFSSAASILAGVSATGCSRASERWASMAASRSSNGSS